MEGIKESHEEAANLCLNNFLSSLVTFNPDSCLSELVEDNKQLLMVHTCTGTNYNDLSLATHVDEFTSDLSTLIIEAATKFPRKSKKVYSTLTPRATIPTPTITKLYEQLNLIAPDYHMYILSAMIISSPKEFFRYMAQDILNVDTLVSLQQT